MVAAIGGLARRGILVRGGIRPATRGQGRYRRLRQDRHDHRRPLRDRQDHRRWPRRRTNCWRWRRRPRRGFDHPLARVIVDEAARPRTRACPSRKTRTSCPGRGAECTIGGRARSAPATRRSSPKHGMRRHRASARTGRRAWAPRRCWSPTASRLAGAILLRDRIREGVREARRRACASIGHHPPGDAHRRPPARRGSHRARDRHPRRGGRAAARAEARPHPATRCRRAARSAWSATASTTRPALAAADRRHRGRRRQRHHRRSRRRGLPAALARKAAATSSTSAAAPSRTAWQNIILFAGVVNLVAVILCGHRHAGPHRRRRHAPAFLVLRDDELAAAAARRNGRAHGMAATAARRALGGRNWLRRASILIDPGRVRHWLVAHRRQLVKPALATAAVLVVLNGFYILRPDENRRDRALRQEGAALRASPACTTSCRGPSSGSRASGAPGPRRRDRVPLQCRPRPMPSPPPTNGTCSTVPAASSASRRNP